MFNLDLIEFPKLQRIDAEDGRRYVTPEGRAYPSVTTVLSKTGDKSGLDAWRERVGEEAADAEGRRAANRGTGLHLLCERYIMNEIIDLRREMPVPAQLFSQIKPLLTDNVDNIRGIEVPLYSDFLRIAGTTDLVAEWRGELAIIDYKSSNKPKKIEWISDYFIQTAVYAMAWEERTGIPIDKLVILMAVEQSVKPLWFVQNTSDWKKPAMKRIRQFYS